MQIFISIFLLTLLFISPSARAEDTISAYESAKQNLTTLSAHFVQKKTFTLFEETEISEGEVWFKKPNRVLWRFASPAPGETVISGNDSWSLVPAAKQVQKAQISSGNANQIFQILGFGQANEKLSDSFEVKEIQDAEEGVETLSLIPIAKTLTPYYSEIIVKLDSVDHLPRHITLKEKSGDITEVIFSEMKTKESIPDSLFELKVPEGYQLIDYDA